jgi:hypothetical protein
MENSAFTMVSLSDVRVIMSIMQVLMEELLCQAVMGWILVPKCPLLGGRGHLCGYVLSCLALNGTAFRGPGSRGTYSVLENLQASIPRAQVCAEPGVMIRQTCLTCEEILLACGRHTGATRPR